MNILFLCFSEAWGGLELMHVKLSKALSARGHRVGVVGSGDSQLLKACAEQGIPGHSLSPSVKYFDPLTAFRLMRIFHDNETQICVIGLSKDISTAALAKRLVPRVSLVYFQQMQFGHDKTDVFHRWSYAHLNLWVTLTNAMRISVLRNTSVPGNKIRVIPFGADLSIFDPGQYSRARSRRIFQLPGKKKVVALIGRYDRQKGQEEFLRAAAVVLKKYPSSHFLLAGEETRLEDGFLKYLRTLARELAIDEHVQFQSYTPDVAGLLRGVDLIVMPSYSETFGYLAVEAMAMGIPVVGTDAGGLPEIIRDGKTGFLVPSGDSVQLAERILRILKSKRLYRTISVNAVSRAKKHFDFRRNIIQFEEELSRLL